MLVQAPTSSLGSVLGLVSAACGQGTSFSQDWALAEAPGQPATCTLGEPQPGVPLRGTDPQEVIQKEEKKNIKEPFTARQAFEASAKAWPGPSPAAGGNNQAGPGGGGQSPD